MTVKQVAKYGFNRALTTLTTEDLAFVGPDGAVPVTSVSRTHHAEGWSEYAVRFDPVGGAGAYQLTVMSTVQDAEGGYLNQDLDDNAGESDDDRYVASWTLAGPKIESHGPSGIMSAPTPLAHFDLVFSDAMDQGSFSLDDIDELTGPDGAILPIGYEWRNAWTLRVTFEPVTVMGTISITIGPEVYDQLGNPLDQNENAVAGEADDTWTGSVIRSSSGTIDRDTVIPSNAGVVVFGDTVTVATGATLTIEPGVTLKFSSGAGLTVDGQLIAQGTVHQPVVFTSSASPGFDAWTGIRVTSSGTIKLNHTEVLHAAKAVDADSIGAHAVLSNTTLRDGLYGVYVYSPYAEVTAENCLIANNNRTGVFVRADSRHSFKNCTIVGNGFGGSGWDGAGIHLGGAMVTLENSIVAFNNTGLHHAGDPPAAIVRNSIFHNPAGQEIVWNDDPGMPDLGADGNKTVDPLFVDRAGGNYELAAGSPAVDSGSGLHGPRMDLLGRSRYDDLGVPNLGNGFPSFVDIGAYERQNDTPHGDLAVVNVSSQGPAFLDVGASYTVDWTVVNLGVEPNEGAWQDAVYLSDDKFLSPDDVVVGTSDHEGPLQPDEFYDQRLTFTVPDTSGIRYVLVQANANKGTPEAVRMNNSTASDAPIGIALPVLDKEAPVSGTLTSGAWTYVRFDCDTEDGVILHLDVHATSGATYLYARYATAPTVDAYDAAGIAVDSTDQQAFLSEPRIGDYYLAIYGQNLGDGATEFTLSAIPTGLAIEDVVPKSVASEGEVTIELRGKNFQPNDEIYLSDSDESVRLHPIAIRHENRTVKFVTFDFDGAQPGQYNIVLVSAEGDSTLLSDAIEITAPRTRQFDARLILPSLARPGRTITVGVEYSNRSNQNLSSPLLILTGPAGSAWQLPGSEEWIESSEVPFLALSSTGPRNVLRPYQTEVVNVRLRTPFDPGDIELRLNSSGVHPDDGSAELIDWEALEQRYRPANVADAVWDPFWADIITLGLTKRDAIEALGQRAATYDQLVYSYDAIFDDLVATALAGSVVFDDRDSPLGSGVYSHGEVTIETALGTSVATPITPQKGNLSKFLAAEDTIKWELGGYAPKWNLTTEWKKMPGSADVYWVDRWGIRDVEGTGLVEAYLDVEYRSPKGDLMQNLLVAAIADSDYETWLFNDMIWLEDDFRNAVDYFRNPPHAASKLLAERLDSAFQGEDDLTGLEFFAHIHELQEGDSDDIAIFYFGGHSTERGPVVHWATEQGTGANTIIERNLLNTAVRNATEHVGRVIVILDTCFSAGHLESPIRENTTLLAATDDANETVAVSVFTRHFFEGLSGDAEDLNGDEWISVGEAMEYAQIQVPIDPLAKTFGLGGRDPAQFGNQTDVILRDNFRPFNWIQVVFTNAPLSGQKSPYVSGSPFYWEDSELAKYTDHANGRLRFLDYPARGPQSTKKVEWRAMLIPTKWDGASGVELYYPGAVWWGFDISIPDGNTNPDAPMPDYALERDKGTIPLRTSSTPEDKFGPTGYDPPGTVVGTEVRHVQAGQTLDYRVDFWNKPDAEVPTQDAIIVDRLDPTVFDVSTLDITRVGFLDWEIEVSSGQVIDTRIDCRPEMNIAVEIKAGLGMEIPGFANNGDIDENTLAFWFHTVDPETSEWPEDPMAGFLPPFDPETGFEIGWIEYTVQPVTGLPSGTELTNVAYVEFDFAGDIYVHPAPKVDPDAEPAVAAPWINTIDAIAPTSQVQALPATTDNEVLTLGWNGQDDIGGSGIASYDIYVATDDGSFELWLNDTPDTEAVFTGSPGHKYAFSSVATDNVGHRENAPLTAEAETTVVYDSWHNAANKYDVNGVDDVTSLDVLTLITYINSQPGDNSLPDAPASPPPFYDVNDDGLCSSLDVLEVIGEINRRFASSGEAETTRIEFPVVIIEPPSISSPSTAATLPAPVCCTAGTPSAKVDRTQRGNQPPQRITWGGRETTPQPGPLEDAEDVTEAVFGQMWDDEAIEELDAVFQELGNVL